MPTFAYRGVSDAGRSVSGLVDAENLRAARAHLREQGIFASDLRSHSGRSEASTGAAPTGGFRRKVGAAELSRTMRQLATLLAAGVPLVEAVSSLRDQRISPRMTRALDSIGNALVEGDSLQAAMSRHPDVFPSIYAGMVGAGEASGSLDTVLVRMADHAEAGARLQQRVRDAMTYPAFMTVVGGGIVAFLLSYVVPQVTRVFTQSHHALPLATRILMWMADAVAAYGILGIAVAIAALLALRYYAGTAGGGRRLERIGYSLPVVGQLAKNVAATRFAQTVATMLSGGMTLVDALETGRSVVGSRLFSDALADAKEAVIQGEPLAPTLRTGNLFNPMVVDMVAVGERSGELDAMLESAARMLDEEVRANVERLASLLAPVTTVLMGAIVMFIVVAVLLPVFEMNQLVR